MPKEPPAEIKAAIDTLLDGFNKKDAGLYSRAFTADAVVVDGMAPYRWTGPNSPGRWFADAEKRAHELGVADESLGDQKVVHAEVVGRTRLCRACRNTLIQTQWPAPQSARNPHIQPLQIRAASGRSMRKPGAA